MRQLTLPRWFLSALGKISSCADSLTEGHTGSTIPVEGEKLEQLFRFIARGLVWFHWRVYVDDETHSVRSLTVHQVFAQALDDFVFKKNARARVYENVGNGAFIYEGVQALDDPALTFWRFLVYGGLMVSGGAPSDPPTSQFIAFMCPQQLDAQLCRVFDIEEP